MEAQDPSEQQLRETSYRGERAHHRGRPHSYRGAYRPRHYHPAPYTRPPPHHRHDRRPHPHHRPYPYYNRHPNHPPRRGFYPQRQYEDHFERSEARENETDGRPTEDEQC